MTPLSRPPRDSVPPSVQKAGLQDPGGFPDPERYLEDKPRPRRWRGLGFFALGFIATTAAACGGLVAYLLPRPVLNSSVLPGNAGIFRTTPALDHALHILVLGTDRPTLSTGATPNGQTPSPDPYAALSGRSDTILLTRFDPVADKITVLSIPRDTRTRIPDQGVGKINAANALGGPVLAAQTVSQLLGNIPIDRYIRLNTEGVQALIDALGGVDVYVPERMKYTDHTQKLFIDLQPGWQHLNGEQAHGFLRFRYNDLGDIGRVQRQQELMRAVSKALLQPQTLGQVPKILSVIQEYVDTNLTWEELLSLAQFMLRSNSQQRLDMILLPGRFSQPGEYGTSYWIVDPLASNQVSSSVFGAAPTYPLSTTTPRPSQVSIAVQNASGHPGMGRTMVRELQRQGFTNTFVVEDSLQVLPTTQILAQRGKNPATAELQSLLGLGESWVESTGILNADITVKVGQDWANRSLTPPGSLPTPSPAPF